MSIDSTLVQAVSQNRRAQPYRLIHKALRADMSAALLRLGQADPHDAAAVRSVLAQVEDLLRLADGHLQHENAHLHVAMRERNPEAIQAFDDEHRTQVEAARALRRALRAAQLAGSGTAAPAALYRLYLELSTWFAQQLLHMAEEETALTAAFWEHFSDAEIHAIEQSLVASIPPQELMPLMGTMLRSTNHVERVGWLQPMSAQMPPEPFAAVLDRARNELPAPEWHKLARALGVPAVDGLVSA